MAVNKNFVVKNGIEVNTNLLVAAAEESQVGVGTTRPYWKFHVNGGAATRGGIGATDITITGIATVGVANSDVGALRVLGISTFQGDIDLLGSAGVSTVLWDASENRLEFKDNASVGFGTGNDLTLWHDGSVSYIKDTVGDLRIAGDKITLELEDGTDVKVIDKFGVNITGVTTSNRLYISGISTFADDVHFDGTYDITFDKSESALVFNDQAAIRVGTGSDFSIQHEGNTTIIRHQNTSGNLNIQSPATVIRNLAGDETIAVFADDDAGVSLYNNHLKRFETVGFGASVLGNLTVSGVNTSGNGNLNVQGIGTFSDKIIAGTAATIDANTGNIAAAGIITANNGIRVGTAITVDANTGNVAVSGILTVGGNLNVTGDITYDEVTGRNLNITGFTTFADDVYFHGSAGVTTVTWDKSADALKFVDNAKAIFGTGSDLKIYHDSSNSYVQDAGTGALVLLSDNTYIKNAADNEYIAKFTEDVGAFLYDGTSAERLRATAGGVVVSGVATATEFVGVFTSAGGAGIGIGSTTAHVGYGVTYIDFKGPGVSTVYSSSVTGITTIYFQGGGGSGVGAAGTWQNDGAQGISTAKSVGINTVGVAVTALQGGEKGASSGIGQTFQGLYISNGMVVNDNQLNGNHYIGTAFGGVMAGPVTVNGIITVDGNWAVV